jgi:hypothetical protein
VLRRCLETAIAILLVGEGCSRRPVEGEKGTESVKTNRSASEVVAGIQNRVPGVSPAVPTEMTVEALSAHYAKPGPAVRARTGGALGGWDLYLFPDQTYFCIQWADVIPRRIFEKGKWEVVDGFVVLHEDGSLPRSTRAKDDRFLAIRLRVGKTDRLLLTGDDRDHTYFLEHAGDDPEFMLLLCSVERQETIARAQAQNLKASLARECTGR